MIYFTADTHYGHSKILEYTNLPYHAFKGRPHSSVEEMNEDFVEKWNAVVKPSDIVYHLGDVGIGAVSTWAPYIKRLTGIKHCVRGNHDPTSTKLIEAGFDYVTTDYYVDAYGTRLWLAHIPINNTSDKRNLVRPQPRADYDIALCGHVHARWLRGPSQEINVGVDVWDFAPVSIDRVIDEALNVL
jgi:calcineurin-like phosphoesterase family protein